MWNQSAQGEEYCRSRFLPVLPGDRLPVSRLLLLLVSCVYSVQENKFWSWTAWIQIPALHVQILGKLFDLVP